MGGFSGLLFVHFVDQMLRVRPSRWIFEWMRPLLSSGIGTFRAGWWNERPLHTCPILIRATQNIWIDRCIICKQQSFYFTNIKFHLMRSSPYQLILTSYDLGKENSVTALSIIVYIFSFIKAVLMKPFSSPSSYHNMSSLEGQNDNCIFKSPSCLLIHNILFSSELLLCWR